VVVCSVLSFCPSLSTVWRCNGRCEDLCVVTVLYGEVQVSVHCSGRGEVGLRGRAARCWVSVSVLPQKVRWGQWGLDASEKIRVLR
jgi:hypothetical protein